MGYAGDTNPGYTNSCGTIGLIVAGADHFIHLPIRYRRDAMQGAVVILMALGGLGCQNKGCDVLPSPQTTRYVSAQSFANACPSRVVPSGYRSWSASDNTGDDCSGYSTRGALRSTLWSFVIGHDPDVATVREIEASFYSGSGHD
jgi:hypothetical protein